MSQPGKVPTAVHAGAAAPFQCTAVTLLGSTTLWHTSGGPPARLARAAGPGVDTTWSHGQQELGRHYGGTHFVPQH